MPPALLEVQNLKISYKIYRRGRLDEKNVNRNISFRLCDGEVFAITGLSGCGKTTLANAIAGLLPEQAIVLGGTVVLNVDGQRIPLIDGRDEIWEEKSARPRFKHWYGHLQWEWWKLRREFIYRRHTIRGYRIAYIFQDSTSLNPYYTISDQFKRLFHLCKRNGISPREKSAESLLELVGMDDSYLNRKPRHLSGGERARIAIALSLVTNPALIIADEFTSGLDVVTESKVVAQMTKLHKEEGLTMLLITHDLGVIERLATRVAVMQQDGTMQQPVSTDEFFAAEPPTEQVQGFRRYADRDLYYDNAVWVREKVSTDGMLLKATHPAIIFTKPQPQGLSEIRPLEKLPDASFDIRRRENVGIVGETGSGKSKFGQYLCKLLEPQVDSSIQLDGTIDRTSGAHSQQQYRNRTQMLFQHSDRIFLPRMRAVGIVTEAYQLHGKLNPNRRINSKTEIRENARRLLAKMKLEEHLWDARPRELSGGQLRRVSLARSLAAVGYRADMKHQDFSDEGRILVADEPTTGLDVSTKAEITELLKELSDLGMTLVIITHDIQLANLLCDWIAVMYEGNIVQLSKRENLLTSDCQLIEAPDDQPHAKYTKQLIAAVHRI